MAVIKWNDEYEQEVSTEKLMWALEQSDGFQGYWSNIARAGLLREDGPSESKQGSLLFREVPDWLYFYRMTGDEDVVPDEIRDNWVSFEKVTKEALDNMDEVDGYPSWMEWMRDYHDEIRRVTDERKN